MLENLSQSNWEQLMPGNVWERKFQVRNTHVKMRISESHPEYFVIEVHLTFPYSYSEPLFMYRGDFGMTTESAKALACRMVIDYYKDVYETLQATLWGVTESRCEDE